MHTHTATSGDTLVFSYCPITCPQLVDDLLRRLIGHTNFSASQVWVDFVGTWIHGDGDASVTVVTCSSESVFFTRSMWLHVNSLEVGDLYQFCSGVLDA